jgi:BolA protein
MSLQNQIEAKLQAAFAPHHLEVENESHMHRVAPGAETHFKVIVVSATFAGKSLIEQQRLVNSTLAAELAGGVHALTMKTLTPERWESLGHKVELVSPACRGGDKK